MNVRMQATELRRAVVAAMSSAAELGLVVDDAAVVNDSNRLVLRLTPCDVIARVTPIAHHGSPEREVELARLLGETDSPVAALDPRVEPRAYADDGFVITFWTPFEPVQTADVSPADYAHALVRLHAEMRHVEITTPHFMDRVADTQHWVASCDVTPDLTEPDRELLADALANLSDAILNRAATEQLLHGEPHPWNVLNTTDGPLFMDFENSVRGPVEFDLAWVPRAVSERYPDADQELVAQCRGLVVAIIAVSHWRWYDQHPGNTGRADWISTLRDGPPWLWLDA